MGLRVLSGSMECWALGIGPTRISCWVGVFKFKGGKPAQPHSEKAVVRTLSMLVLGRVRLGVLSLETLRFNALISSV